RLSWSLPPAADQLLDGLSGLPLVAAADVDVIAALGRGVVHVRAEPARAALTELDVPGQSVLVQQLGELGGLLRVVGGGLAGVEVLVRLVRAGDRAGDRHRVRVLAAGEQLQAGRRCQQGATGSSDGDSHSRSMADRPWAVDGENCSAQRRRFSRMRTLISIG